MAGCSGVKDRSLCNICSLEEGKYVCPKCNILYCSLVCYKADVHIQCTETFYRECVLNELTIQENDPSSKKKVLEILKSVQEYNDSESSNDSNSLDSDDEENIYLSDRLAGINLEDPDAVWKHLNKYERAEFQKLLESGKITEILPDWKPWWLYRKKKKLIEEDENEEEVVDYQSLCPPLMTDIPLLENITKAVPSPCLSYLLLHILLSYVFVTRWMKGVHHEMLLEAVTTLHKVCVIFNSNHVIKSISEALDMLDINIQQCIWIKYCNEDVHLIIHETKKIIMGPDDIQPNYYIEAALSDIYHMFVRACEVVQTDVQKQTFVQDVPKPKQLLLISKKLIYYISWVRSEHSVDQIAKLREDL